MSQSQLSQLLGTAPTAVLAAVVALLVLEYLRRRRRRPDDDPLPTAPHTYRPAADRLARLTVTASRALQTRRGDAPAASVARQLHAALADADLPHRIDVVDADPVPPAEGTVGSGAPAWWREHGPDVVDPGDANLLLVDQVGGGGTYSEWAVVGAGGIGEQLPATDERGEAAGDSLSAALHEVGHCFGLAHDLEDDVAGKQHTGTGYNEGGVWYRTPMCVDHGVTNACGEPVPEREFDDVVQRLFYTDCTAERWSPFGHRE